MITFNGLFGALERLCGLVESHLGRLKLAADFVIRSPELLHRFSAGLRRCLELQKR